MKSVRLGFKLHNMSPYILILLLKNVNRKSIKLFNLLAGKFSKTHQYSVFTILLYFCKQYNFKLCGIQNDAGGSFIDVTIANNPVRIYRRIFRLFRCMANAKIFLINSKKRRNKNTVLSTLGISFYV